MTNFEKVWQRLNLREKEIGTNTAIAEAGLLVWTITADPEGETKVKEENNECGEAKEGEATVEKDLVSTSEMEKSEMPLNLW